MVPRPAGREPGPGGPVLRFSLEARRLETRGDLKFQFNSIGQKKTK